MNAFQERVEQLNSLIIAGKTLQAVELFYADNIVMQENEEEVRVGKENA